MNNYHIYEEVGRGKYSVVYKGRIKKNIKYVAVKSVERSRRRKLMNEVRIFHDLQHKNVLRFYNWYETRNHLWIIFEYCPGGDLYQLIEQDKPLPENTVRKFGYELVEGLSYLHANGIIFADLKPSNILLNEYGILKFADFGLSKKLSDFQQGPQESSNAALGLSGSEVGKPKAGTPFYMAPELFEDNGVHSFYSDFWSLGCVLYELVAGKPPFSSDSLKNLIHLIVEGETPLPIDNVIISSDLTDLLRKLLEKDPMKRINWEELRAHPWWKTHGFEFTKRTYPQQTQFDQYLRSKGIVPEHFYDQRNNPLVKKLSIQQQQTSQSNKVDILRLSHNVRRNMKKEQDEDDTGPNSTASSGSGQYGAGGSHASGSSHIYNKQGSSSSTLMMGSGGSTQLAGMSIPQQTQVKQVQAAPDNDDVTLNNNRRMVLNFGERSDLEDEDNSPASVNNYTSGTQTDASSTPNNRQGVLVPQQTQPGASLLADIDVSLQPTQQQQQKQGKIIPPQQQTKLQNFYGQQQTTFSGLDQANEDDQAQILYQGGAGTAPLSSRGQEPGKKTMQPQNNTLINVPSQGRLQSTTNQLFTKVASNNNILKPQSTISPQQQKELQLLITQVVFAGKNNQLPISSTAQDQSKVPVKSMDQLLTHNSDTAVKPIIGNKEIERTSEPPLAFEKNALSFAPWTADQVTAMMDTQQFEAHLNELYGCLSNGAGSVTEKVNALLYFESIIVNSNVSNRLINSAFLSLLLKLLKTSSSKSPPLRTRICSVLGLLIRHSTVIENEVAESDLCQQLVEVLTRERNEKVRRKAVAALGEYMFYAATQLDEEGAEACWEIREDAINAIIKCLRVETSMPVSPEQMPTDETVVFYAVKTLENITAQSTSAGARFATAESVSYLLQLFLGLHTPQGAMVPTFANEHLRTSAAIALSHICRLQAKLFPIVLNKVTPKLFVYTLSEAQPRVQQAFLSMLNQALQLGTYPKLSELLIRLDSQSEQEGIAGQQQTYAFLPTTLRLLEHTQIVVRGKALLTFLLLFKQDFRWLALLQPNDPVLSKFFHVLDRLSRDTYKYVQCCLLCLTEGIVTEVVPAIFSSIADELNSILSTGRGLNTSQPLSEFDKGIMQRGEFETLGKNSQQQATSLVYVSVLIDLMQAQCLKQRMITQGFIKALSTLIETCESGQQFPGGEEFLRALLLIVESISSSQKVLMQMSEPIISIILPCLLSKTSAQGSGAGKQLPSADIRFLSLKIFTDLVIQYLHDDSVYDPTIQDESNPTAKQTNLLSEMLINQLFPKILSLLQDAEPLPLYALKLLSAVLERNPPFFAKQLRRQEPLLLPLIAENYQVGHPRLNRHTINIVKSVIQAKELSLIEVQNFRIADKTHTLLKQTQSKQSLGDWCTEILLDVLQLLLAQLIEVVKTRENEIARLIDEILGSFDMCVNLLGGGSNASQSQSGVPEVTTERASQCLILMLQLYALCTAPNAGGRKREIYFTEAHMSQLILSLKQILISSTPQQLSQQSQQSDKKIIIKRILKCIYWALIQSEYQIRLVGSKSATEKKVMLEQVVKELMQISDDRSIQNTTREIYKQLKEQYQSPTENATPMTAGGTGAIGFTSMKSDQQSYGGFSSGGYSK